MSVKHSVAGLLGSGKKLPFYTQKDVYWSHQWGTRAS